MHIDSVLVVTCITLFEMIFLTIVAVRRVLRTPAIYRTCRECGIELRKDQMTKRLCVKCDEAWGDEYWSREDEYAIALKVLGEDYF